MSRAKALIEAMGAPAAPPQTRPGTKPTAPARPAPAKPSTNPFRRDRVRPGEEPRPKAMGAACMEAKGLKQPAQGGKAPHAFSKAKAAISSKTSGTGASGLTAKKAFKK